MISVIVPLYNGEKYISMCLESIVNQSYRDFELIIVDDGSKDNGAQVAEQYLKDKEISYCIYRKENGGQSSARNYGLSEAKGEYICFIDSDDVVTSNYLERLYNALIINDVDFSFCGYKFVSEQSINIDNNDRQSLYSQDELLDLFLKRKLSFLVVSLMLKKSFINEKKLYFDENIKYSEDQLYIWELLFSCKNAVYLDAKMYGYYVRESSIMTSSDFNKISSSFKYYEKFIEQLKGKYPYKNDFINLIMPRWQLGTLYTAANILSRDEFYDLYNMMNGKTIFNRVKNIKEIKAILLAVISSISSDAMYKFCRRLKLNG